MINKEKEIEKLNKSGRHESEWVYAPYDGRKNMPEKNGGYIPPHWNEPIKRSRKEPLTKEELEYRQQFMRDFKE